jgi:cobaltochelatase CobS
MNNEETNGMVTCRICGERVHAIQVHLKRDHPEVSLSDYASKYPDAPLLSSLAMQRLAQARQQKKAAEQKAAEQKAVETVLSAPTVKTPLHKVFGLDPKENAEGLSALGLPILITVIVSTPFANMVPKVLDTYVYDPNELKYAVMAFEFGLPLYVYGHKGSGKSKLLEQIAARTGRPFVRVQHTVNTEGSHIVGQWVVRNGQTEYEWGPLALAMMNGWTYCADEFDFALPSVLSIYQAVLEGEPLYVNDAPADRRLVRPHPDFRFVATGNTNGGGDETGLYQGTSMQNAAAFDRFGVTLCKNYMEAKAETHMLMKAANLVKGDATRLVKFGTLVRDAYAAAKISDLISPRALINAARIGLVLASFVKGLELAFINKLSTGDRNVVNSIAQRVFGESDDESGSKKADTL